MQGRVSLRPTKEVLFVRSPSYSRLSEIDVLETLDGIVNSIPV